MNKVVTQVVYLSIQNIQKTKEQENAFYEYFNVFAMRIAKAKAFYQFTRCVIYDGIFTISHLITVLAVKFTHSSHIESIKFSREQDP
jgi:hypothetical protein